MKIVFKNLIPMDTTKSIVQDRLIPVLSKFPGNSERFITVTLEMENSPRQAGPDHFSVSVHITDGPYRGIKITKEAMDLMVALASVTESLFTQLSKHNEKIAKKKKLGGKIKEVLAS